MVGTWRVPRETVLETHGPGAGYLRGSKNSIPLARLISSRGYWLLPVTDGSWLRTVVTTKLLSPLGGAGFILEERLRNTQIAHGRLCNADV